MLNIVDLRSDFDEAAAKDLYRKLTQRTETQNGGNVITIVAEIIDTVKQNGDTALKEYTKRFDKAEIEDIKVSEEEITSAYKKVDLQLLETIKKSRENIWSFHEKQLQNSWVNPKEDGTMLGQLVRPLEKVAYMSQEEQRPLYHRY